MGVVFTCCCNPRQLLFSRDLFIGFAADKDCEANRKKVKLAHNSSATVTTIVLRISFAELGKNADCENSRISANNKRAGEIRAQISALPACHSSFARRVYLAHSLIFSSKSETRHSVLII